MVFIIDTNSTEIIFKLKSYHIKQCQNIHFIWQNFFWITTQSIIMLPLFFAKCIAIEMILLDLSFKMNLWWIYYVVTFLQLICMWGCWCWKALICRELHPSLKHYKTLGHQQPARLIHSASVEDAGLSVGYKAWLMADWLHCMWNRLV